MAKKTVSKSKSTLISAHNKGQIVIEPENLDRFVMTQPEVVLACVSAENSQARKQEFHGNLLSFLSEINAWCEKRVQVSRCVVTARSTDLIVALLASGEDADGELHREMSLLEIEQFNRIPMSVQWILFRSSEAEGFDEFVANGDPLEVYSA